ITSLAVAPLAPALMTTRLIADMRLPRRPPKASRPVGLAAGFTLAVFFALALLLGVRGFFALAAACFAATKSATFSASGLLRISSWIFASVFTPSSRENISLLVCFAVVFLFLVFIFVLLSFRKPLLAN